MSWKAALAEAERHRPRASGSPLSLLSTDDTVAAACGVGVASFYLLQRHLLWLTLALSPLFLVGTIFVVSASSSVNAPPFGGGFSDLARLSLAPMSETINAAGHPSGTFFLGRLAVDKRGALLAMSILDACAVLLLLAGTVFVRRKMDAFEARYRAASFEVAAWSVVVTGLREERTFAKRARPKRAAVADAASADVPAQAASKTFVTGAGTSAGVPQPDDARLAERLRAYLERHVLPQGEGVASVVICRDVGSALRATRRLAASLDRLAEAEAWLPPTDAASTSPHAAADDDDDDDAGCLARFFKKRRERRIVRLRGDVLAAHAAREAATACVPPLVCAFVTCATVAGRAALLDALPASLRARAARWLQGDRLPPEGDASFRDGRSIFSALKARPAPCPANLCWENLGVRAASLVLRRAAAVAALLCLLLCCAGVALSAKAIDSNSPPGVDCAASARWGTLSCAPAWPLSAPSVVLPPTSPPRNATAAASATAAAVAAARADVTSRRGASSPRVCSSVYTDDVFNTFDAGGGTHPTGPVPMSAWWNPTTLLPRADAAAFPASAAVADCAAAACYACFCSSLGLVAGSDGGPSGDAAFCSSWLAASARRWGAKAGSVATAVVANAILLRLVPPLASFCRHTSAARAHAWQAAALLAGTFCNTLVVTLLAFADLPALSEMTIAFDGPFSDTSAGWFVRVGTSLLVATLVQAALAPAGVLASVLAGRISTLRPFRTRVARTQARLDALARGPPWRPALRLGQLLQIFFLVLALCGAFPPLFWLLPVFFPIFACVDKWALLGACRAPPRFDASLVRGAHKSFVWAVWLHFGLTAWMYGSPSLPSYGGGTASQQQKQAAAPSSLTGPGVAARMRRAGALVQALPFFVLTLWLLGHNVRATAAASARRLLCCCFSTRRQKLERQRSAGSVSGGGSGRRGAVSMGSLPSAAAAFGGDSIGDGAADGTDAAGEPLPKPGLAFEEALRSGRVRGLSSYRICDNPSYEEPLRGLPPQGAAGPAVAAVAAAAAEVAAAAGGQKEEEDEAEAEAEAGAGGDGVAVEAEEGKGAPAAADGAARTPRLSRSERLLSVQQQQQQRSRDEAQQRPSPPPDVEAPAGPTWARHTRRFAGAAAAAAAAATATTVAAGAGAAATAAAAVPRGEALLSSRDDGDGSASSAAAPAATPASPSQPPAPPQPRQQHARPPPAPPSRAAAVAAAADASTPREDPIVIRARAAAAAAAATDDADALQSSAPQPVAGGGESLAERGADSGRATPLDPVVARAQAAAAARQHEPYDDAMNPFGTGLSAAQPDEASVAAEEGEAYDDAMNPFGESAGAAGGGEAANPFDDERFFVRANAAFDGAAKPDRGKIK